MDAKTIVLTLSAIIALIAVINHARTSRRQATIDLVIHQKNDEHLAEARSTVTRLNSDNELTTYAHSQHKGTAERNAILAVLNNYEFIATGMREGAFDLKLYKRMSYSTVVSDWKALKPFIYDLRRQVQRDTIFQEFEWLAERFCNRKLKADRKS